MASIIYALIASDDSPTPLVDVSLADGNFQQLALKLLAKKRLNTTASYSYENQYIFHYHNNNGFTFLCLADSGFSNKTAFSFLFDIQEKVYEKYGEDAKKAIGYGMSKGFSDTLKQRMIFFSTDKTADKLRTVRENIDKTKDIMIENIDKVLARGEKIEMLVDKTNYMSEKAAGFKKQAVRVKRHFWWKNTKLILLFVAIFIVFFI